MSGHARFRALRCAAVLTAAFVVLLAGCPQRQEILEHTVRAHGETAAARIEARHVPEELLTWELVAEIAPRFDEVTAVAFDADDGLLIAGDGAVGSFDADGSAAWEMQVDETPTCLAVGAGMIAVGMKQRVVIYGADWTPVSEIVPGNGRTWITSVAVTGEEIFLADAGNRRILAYDIEGRPRGEIGATDPDRGIPALSVPSPHLEVAIGPDGNLWMTNPGRRSLQKHSPDTGDLLASFGRSGTDLEGFSGCCNPTDIAVLPDGRIVTSEKGIPRVKVYSPEGELLSVLAPPESFSPMTAGIDLSADWRGRVAVLDPSDGIVRVYEDRQGGQAGDFEAGQEEDRSGEQETVSE